MAARCFIFQPTPAQFRRTVSTGVMPVVSPARPVTDTNRVRTPLLSRRVLGLVAALCLMVATGAVSTVAPTPSAAFSMEADGTGGPVGQDGTVDAPVMDQRPNIVFITTDDQRTDEMRWMPHTRSLLGGHGVTFRNGLSPHPLCCPARAEWMTGQYGQNNGVEHNHGSRGGFPALRDKPNTLGAWLAEAGYQTAMSGKFMNGYKPKNEGLIPGWTHWNPTVRKAYSYFNTTFYNDGDEVLRTNHVHDAVGDFTRGYIREFAQNDEPFFVWASNLSPHGRSLGGTRWGPPPPAARHRHQFRHSRSPSRRKPSFAVPTQGWTEKSASRRGLAKINANHRARIRSLQAVDEQVRDIVGTLSEVGELDNTYIVFASDNGFLLGEHRLIEKNYLYEEALNVPILVRVPDTTGGRVVSAPVTLTDLAPTFVDLADATPRRVMDGTSIVPILNGTARGWRDTQLIQTGYAHYGPGPSWKMRGVRTNRYTYGRNMLTGREQLFDRKKDKFEMTNRATLPAYRPVVRALRSRLRNLKDCSGTTCNRSFGSTPAPVRPRR